jgi:hypothetical protein
LKGVVTRSEWNVIKSQLKFNFIEDNHFAELKNSEVLRERLSLLQDVDQFAGKYYSEAWIRKNVLLQTEEEVEEINSQIEDEDTGEDEEDFQ